MIQPTKVEKFWFCSPSSVYYFKSLSKLPCLQASVKRAIRDLEKQIDRETSCLDPKDRLGLNSSHLASIKAKTQLRDELEAGNFP